MITREQEYVIQQALVRGLAKNYEEAYEVGCVVLRRQLQELHEEEMVKLEVAACADAEAMALNPFTLA